MGRQQKKLNIESRMLYDQNFIGMKLDRNILIIEGQRQDQMHDCDGNHDILFKGNGTYNGKAAKIAIVGSSELIDFYNPCQYQAHIDRHRRFPPAGTPYGFQSKHIINAYIIQENQEDITCINLLRKDDREECNNQLSIEGLKLNEDNSTINGNIIDNVYHLHQENPQGPRENSINVALKDYGIEGLVNE